MKIDTMTPEQDRQMIAFREEWRAIGLATGPADLEAIRPVINDFYARIGKDAPYLWRCESPMMAQFVISFLWDNLGDNLGDNLRANLGDNLWDNLWANLGDNLWANLGANLRANLGDNLWDNLRDNLWANLGDNLWANLWANLGDNLRDNLWDNLWAKKIEYISTYLWGSLDSYWIAHYLFPHNFLRPMHTDEQVALLTGWATIAKNAFWWYPFEGICFVCDRPDEYHFDEQWRLHNPDGAAVRFSDGYSLFAVHGVMLPAWIIEQPKNITVDKICDEQNAEIRRVMIDKYGQARYLTDSGAELVHSDGYGDLYRAVVPEDEPLVMVKVVNSTPERDGSYKDYFIRVPPDTRTAEQAVAWIGGFDVGKFEYVNQS